MAIIPTIAAIGSTLWNIGKKIFQSKAVGKIGETLVQAAPAAAASIMTNQTNRKYAEKAYNQNLKMYEDQKAYNSPAAQMERYKEAGLNPHLIYGQGSPGNIETAPAMQYNPVNPMEFSSVLTGSRIAQMNQNITQSEAAVSNLKQMMERRSLDINYLEKTMDERVALVHQGLHSAFMKNGHMTVDLVNTLKRSGYFATLTTENAKNMLFDFNVSSKYREEDDLIFKSFDASVQRLYNSGDAITLDNARRKIEISFLEKGITLGSGLLNQFGRILIRLGKNH